MVLKEELSHAHDKVIWMNVRSMLIHLGFYSAFVNWVINYTSSISFFVLANASV